MKRVALTSKEQYQESRQDLPIVFAEAAAAAPRLVRFFDINNLTTQSILDAVEKYYIGPRERMQALEEIIYLLRPLFQRKYGVTEEKLLILVTAMAKMISEGRRALPGHTLREISDDEIKDMVIIPPLEHEPRRELPIGSAVNRPPTENPQELQLNLQDDFVGQIFSKR